MNISPKRLISTPVAIILVAKHKSLGYILSSRLESFSISSFFKNCGISLLSTRLVNSIGLRYVLHFLFKFLLLIVYHLLLTSAFIYLIDNTNSVLHISY